MRFYNQFHCTHYNVDSSFSNISWRGAWKTALSDFWYIARFSFQINLYLIVKYKENLTLHQKSLRALVQLFPDNQGLFNGNWLLRKSLSVAFLADALLARHAIFTPQRWGGKIVWWAKRAFAREASLSGDFTCTCTCRQPFFAHLTIMQGSKS